MPQKRLSLGLSSFHVKTSCFLYVYDFFFTKGDFFCYEGYQTILTLCYWSSKVLVPNDPGLKALITYKVFAL